MNWKIKLAIDLVGLASLLVSAAVVLHVFINLHFVDFVRLREGNIFILWGETILATFSMLYGIDLFARRFLWEHIKGMKEI